MCMTYDTSVGYGDRRIEKSKLKPTDTNHLNSNYVICRPEYHINPPDVSI